MGVEPEGGGYVREECSVHCVLSNLSHNDLGGAENVKCISGKRIRNLLIIKEKFRT